MRSKLLIGGMAAAAAILLATNPLIAQAAGFITSADIVNGTIKGKDVKNDSIKGQDVNEASLVLPALPAVVEGPIATSGTLTGGEDTVATLTYTAPANGFVRVTGSASMYANASPNANVTAHVYDGASKIGSAYWDAGDADTRFDLHQTIDAVAPVTAGSHTYTLRLDDALGSNFTTWGYAQVILEFFPTGVAPVNAPNLRSAKP